MGKHENFVEDLEKVLKIHKIFTERSENNSDDRWEFKRLKEDFIFKWSPIYNNFDKLKK